MREILLKRKFQLIIFILLMVHPLVRSQGNVRLNVTVEGLRNNTGILYITLFNAPDGFPDDADKAYVWKKLQITANKGTFQFDGLPPGNYAFSVLHDENSNGKMEKNFLGIPREGFAFSNNYSPRISSPSFKDAAFRFEGISMSLKVKAIYY